MRASSIAVVISHYQQHNQLIQALKSVACQTRTVDQVIVVDDASEKAPERRELEEACNRPISFLLNSRNSGGPGIPRNQGVSACKCSHLLFLDADDVLLPRAVEALESVWSRDSAVIAYGDQISWGPGLDKPFLQKSIPSRSPEECQLWEFHDQLLMSTRRVFLSGSGGATEIFRRHCFDPEQRWEDYDLWLRLAQKHFRFQHTGEIHTLYRLQVGSRSGSREARHQGCIGIREKHFKNIPPWNWPLWYWKQRYL
jgi:glycosyltransferase involved in cell wall biosynthesis